MPHEDTKQFPDHIPKSSDEAFKMAHQYNSRIPIGIPKNSAEAMKMAHQYDERIPSELPKNGNDAMQMAHRFNGRVPSTYPGGPHENPEMEHGHEGSMPSPTHKQFEESNAMTGAESMPHEHSHSTKGEEEGMGSRKEPMEKRSVRRVLYRREALPGKPQIRLCSAWPGPARRN